MARSTPLTMRGFGTKDDIPAFQSAFQIDCQARACARVLPSGQLNRSGIMESEYRFRDSVGHTAQALTQATIRSRSSSDTPNREIADLPLQSTILGLPSATSMFHGVGLCIGCFLRLSIPSRCVHFGFVKNFHRAIFGNNKNQWLNIVLFGPLFHFWQ